MMERVHAVIDGTCFHCDRFALLQGVSKSHSEYIVRSSHTYSDVTRHTRKYAKVHHNEKCTCFLKIKDCKGTAINRFIKNHLALKQTLFLLMFMRKIYFGRGILHGRSFYENVCMDEQVACFWGCVVRWRRFIIRKES